MKRSPLRRKTGLAKAPIKRKAFESSHSKRTKATPMKRCDVLFSKIVRSRGVCEAAGTRWHRACKGNLQAAHIQPRTYHSIRHDEDNALSLCLGAHVYFTHRPVEWTAFIGEARWLALYRRALAGLGTKVNWKAREAELRARAHELGLL